MIDVDERMYTVFQPSRAPSAAALIVGGVVGRFAVLTTNLFDDRLGAFTPLWQPCRRFVHRGHADLQSWNCIPQRRPGKRGGRLLREKRSATNFVPWLRRFSSDHRGHKRRSIWALLFREPRRAPNDVVHQSTT